MKRFNTLLFVIIMTMLSSSVYAQCNSNFSYSVDPKDSSKYTFYDSSNVKGSNITSAYWYISDGSSLIWKTGNYTHKFAKPGNYVVCHYVEDSARSCYDSICTSITVTFKTKACNANFSEKINLDKVSFLPHDSTSNYFWSFGDGTSSTMKLPAHTYNMPYNKVMTYKVCLTVYDSIKSCSDTTCKNITLYKVDSCQARFTYSKGSKKVVFANNSATTGTKIGWTWSFGDGTSSAAKSPTHTYSSFGTRVVCLTLMDSVSGCRSTYCDSVFVDSAVSTKCSANFVSGSKDLEVYFTNKSIGGTSYAWSFGDGNSSSSKDPKHTYSKPGTYSVCLAISGTSCVDSFCQNVTVDTSHCRAAFKVMADTSKKFSMFIVNNSSNLGSHEYYWDFGDSTYSTQRNPTHTYSAYGKYYVCLVVTDTFYGCAHTHCDYVGMDSSGKMLKSAFTFTVVDEEPSSVSSTEELQAKVYPNPVSNTLHFETTSNAPVVSAKVYNMSGMAVIEKASLTSNEHTIDVQELPVGLYILQITDGDKIFRQRFIKSNK